METRDTHQDMLSHTMTQRRLCHSLRTLQRRMVSYTHKNGVLF